jgi:tetratricopeptide (TPR) repeat protein
MSRKSSRKSRGQVAPRNTGKRDHDRRSRALEWLIPLAIAAFTVVAFLPVLGAQFVAYDDPENFLQNLRYRGLGWTQLKWMWTTTHLGHYVPLSWMSLGLDYELWGMNPAGYHAVNLLLHAANAVLLYFVARRLFRNAGVNGAADGDGHTIVLPSAFAALIFAVHPLRVESVAWITERRDMVSLLFSLATVLLFLRATDDELRHRRWYALSIAMYVCAVLSKATAVTLPAALLVLDVFPLRRVGGTAGWWSASARRAYRDLLPFVAASLVAGLVSIVALQPGVQLPLAEKLAVSAYGFVFYLWKSIAPVDLAPLYERRLALQLLSPTFIVSYVVAVGVIAIAWLARRRWPAVTAALVAFTAAIFPLLGIVQNGPQIAADRYTYHAAPALALLFGAAFTFRQRRWLVVAAGVTLVGGFGFLTSRQSRVWENSETLWSRVLQFDSVSYLANNNLGVVLAERGNSSDAIEHYRRSIRTRPSYVYAHNNLGFELAQRGDVDAAIAEYKTALAIRPEYADAEVNLGNALFTAGRVDEALVHYATAARIDPERAGIQFNWGLALRRRGDVDAAIGHYRRALSIDPGFVDAKRELDDAIDARQRERGVAYPR